MVQLTAEEKAEVVANCDHLKTLRFSPHLPRAFTEHGAVMLSAVAGGLSFFRPARYTRPMLKALSPWLYLGVPWSLCLLFWTRGSFGAARFFAVCGTLVLDQFAAYQWQAYDRGWALAGPFVLGLAVVTACGRARGEEANGAALRALTVVGLPILLIFMTYPYFGKMFLLMRADISLREHVTFSGQIHVLPPQEKEAAVRELVAALAHEDVFVRWGAVHQLWLSGPSALPAAEAVAKVVSASPPIPLASAHLRRDGARLLGTLGPEAVPAVLLLLREGDKEIQSDALDALTRIGPQAKTPALAALARYGKTAPSDHSYRLKSAREALGITEQEWSLALNSP